jgi:hypothetical protein
MTMKKQIINFTGLLSLIAALDTPDSHSFIRIPEEDMGDTQREPQFHRTLTRNDCPKLKATPAKGQKVYATQYTFLREGFLITVDAEVAYTNGKRLLQRLNALSKQLEEYVMYGNWLNLERDPAFRIEKLPDPT